MEQCADLFKIFPTLPERLAADPSMYPRIRCFILVKDKNDPTRIEGVRVHSWDIPNLRDLYVGMGKDCSHAVSTLVVPFLLNEMNTMREPQQVGQRNLAFEYRGFALAFTEMAENGDRERFRRCVEGLLRDEGDA